MTWVAEESIEEDGVFVVYVGGSTGSLGVGLKRFGSAAEASNVS
jgi:hypothetical protein